MDAGSPRGYGSWPVVLTLFGGGFGAPAALLFALASLIDRGSLAAAVAAIVVELVPAAAIFVAGLPAGLVCPALATLPSLYAVVRCWDAVSELRDARRRKTRLRGFEPVMAPQADAGHMTARPRVMPPRPKLAGRQKPPDQPLPPPTS